MANAQKTVEFFACRNVSSVDPSVLHVRSGETVDFANVTEKDVRIFFPKRGLFGTDLEDVKSGAKTRPLTVLPPKPDKPVTYHYAVFCDETDSFAVGGSNPKIILLP